MPSFSFCPINYVSKKLNIPWSNAYYFRSIAIKQGFIEVKNRYAPLTVGIQSKSLLVSEYNFENNRLKHFNAKLNYQLPDELKSNIEIVSKRILKRTFTNA